MNWQKWDIALLGRTAGLLIMVGGLAIATWELLDRPDRFPADDAARLFIQNVLSSAFLGLVVLLVAELANLLPWLGEAAAQGGDEVGGTDAPPAWLSRVWAITDVWDIPQLGRAAGVGLIVLGIILSAWSVIDSDTGTPFFDNNNKARLFVDLVLHHLFNGALIIVLAEFVDRIGWRREEEPDGAEGSAPT